MKNAFWGINFQSTDKERWFNFCGENANKPSTILESMFSYACKTAVVILSTKKSEFFKDMDSLL